MNDSEIPRHKKRKRKQRNRPFLVQIRYPDTPWGWLTYARFSDKARRDQAITALKKSKKYAEVRAVDKRKS